MPKQAPRILMIGYGNPGRQDDGLGPAFIAQFEAHASDQLHLQTNYQLTVEDAYDAQAYDQVIFVDASIDARLNTETPFSFEAIEATNDSGLGSHSLSPNGVIRLCETLYDKSPKAFVLGILGYEFDQFEERLSGQASQNLQKASIFLQNWLQSQANA